ncbi:hypothetical protein ACF06X_01650 [Streptomyces sp. NPDC015346]|uniref:hypothetical protein n=1 Tax=Streptomyces sp. NPDC015346 TaxID=3364954 RepID=UPI0036FC0EF0
MSSRSPSQPSGSSESLSQSPSQPPSQGSAGRLVAAVPGGAAALLYAWAAWCFGGPSSPSTTVAVSVGGALVLGAGVTYFLLVDGNTGFFGALALIGGLLLTVAVADQAASRGETATCVVTKIREELRKSVGEGGAEKTLYHHTLRCPGGYPSSLGAEDRRVAPEGGEVRVAYDAERRVAPAVEGSSSPWRPALLALPLLALATAGAARGRRTVSEERPA